jgi:hypothetical protein
MAKANSKKPKAMPKKAAKASAKAKGPKKPAKSSFPEDFDWVRSFLQSRTPQLTYF